MLGLKGLTALSRGFYAHLAILKTEEALGTRLRFTGFDCNYIDCRCNNLSLYLIRVKQQSRNLESMNGRSTVLVSCSNCWRVGEWEACDEN